MIYIFYNIYLFDYFFIFCKKEKNIYIVTFDKFNA